MDKREFLKRIKVARKVVSATFVGNRRGVCCALNQYDYNKDGFGFYTDNPLCKLYADLMKPKKITNKHGYWFGDSTMRNVEKRLMSLDLFTIVVLDRELYKEL